MQQITQTSMGSALYRKTTHRAQFLAQMHQVVPWATLCAALDDSMAMRAFVGVDGSREPVPDQTTIWRFRLLLEHRGLGRQDLSGDRERHQSGKVAADASP
jgi:hypothetical protein